MAKAAAKPKSPPPLPPAPPTLNIEEARASLRRFASRAWRRPATDAELDRYLKVLESELAVGRVAGIRVSIGAGRHSHLEELLLSGRRLRRTNTESRSTTGNWPRGCRICCGVRCRTTNSSRRQPEANSASPQVLRAQLARMLGDAKIERFTDAFPQQWLQLHRVGHVPARSPSSIPITTIGSNRAWCWKRKRISKRCFARICRCENSSSPIGRWSTTAGAALRPAGAGRARLPESETPARGPSRRLAHASVDPVADLRRHTASSGASRRVGVGSDLRPHAAASAAECRTARTHARSTNRRRRSACNSKPTPRMPICASCHRKIDPLGFAFDNFDAIGRWRTEEQVDGGKGDEPAGERQRRAARRPGIQRPGRIQATAGGRTSTASPRRSSSNSPHSPCAA